MSTSVGTQGSRARMLDAAITLMRGSGLSGAGINEIVRESGAPKGSVYHFFPNGKGQIVAEAIELHSYRVQDFIQQALQSQERPADKVRALFNAFARRVSAGDFQASCAAGAVALDLDADLEELRLVLQGAFSRWITLVAQHFDFADARQNKSFAGLVLTTIEGAYIRCRVDRSSRPFKEAGEWLAELAEQR